MYLCVQAFIKVMNTKSSQVDACLLLSKFIDSSLKKPSTKQQKVDSNDLSLDEKLDSVVCLYSPWRANQGQIVLFKFIQDKDVFQRHYSKMLAKRLVFASSISRDAEADMIQRLGVACGLEYTQRLSRMFKDMETSSELTLSFLESRFYRDIQSDMSKYPPFEFNASILTSGSWPLTRSTSTLILSRQLSMKREAFSKFYMVCMLRVLYD